VRQRRSRIAQRLNVRPGETPVPTGNGWEGASSLRLASSLAAALMDSHFEHPARLDRVISNLDTCDGHRSQNEFFRNLLDEFLFLGCESDHQSGHTVDSAQEQEKRFGVRQRGVCFGRPVDEEAQSDEDRSDTDEQLPAKRHTASYFSSAGSSNGTEMAWAHPWSWRRLNGQSTDQPVSDPVSAASLDKTSIETT